MQTTIDGEKNVECTKIQLVLKHGNICASFTQLKQPAIWGVASEYH